MLCLRFGTQRRQRANRGADKSALDATRSRAGMRYVGPFPTTLAHPRTRATVGGAQRLRLHPPLPLAAGTLARRRLVSILHSGRPCAAGSSRSSTRVESGLGVGSCPRLALRAAWSPSSSPSCALRADLPRPRRRRGRACTAGAGPRGREGRRAIRGGDGGPGRRVCCGRLLRRRLRRLRLRLRLSPPPASGETVMIELSAGESDRASE